MGYLIPLFALFLLGKVNRYAPLLQVHGAKEATILPDMFEKLDMKVMCDCVARSYMNILNV